MPPSRSPAPPAPPSRRTPRLARSTNRIRPGVFAELQRHVEERRARLGTDDMVPLHIGDTYLAPPEAAQAVLRDGASAAHPDIFRYGATTGVPELATSVAHHLRTLGLPYDDGREVHVTVGATHALFCAARALLDPGDEVLVSTPCWPLAPGVFTSAGAEVVEIAPPAGDRAGYAAAFAAHIGPRTRALYIGTPNNPDGRVLTSAELEALADLARSHDLWVLSDEVYADLTYDALHLSIASRPGMRERTVVVGSLSKSYALAGARIGYLAGPDAVLTAARRISTHTVFNVPVLLQRAAVAALDHGAAWIASARATYRHARDAAAEALVGSGLDFTLPAGGSYLFLDLTKRARAAGEASALPLLVRAANEGVLLTPGDASGAAFPFHARLCFTSVAEPRVLEGIARLRHALGC